VFYSVQSLDYVGIPFRCNRFHNYGHVLEICSLPFERMVWLKKKSMSKTNKRGFGVGTKTFDYEENVYNNYESLFLGKCVRQVLILLPSFSRAFLSF